MAHQRLVTFATTLQFQNHPILHVAGRGILQLLPMICYVVTFFTSWG